ncbi:MAG: DNA repair protein RecN [Chitinophagia bacterium]|jgi:DNA repair protein RecN (Recombination protein N)
MLTRLEIQNYILIDHLTIDLSNQLSVITGETGAGKSIIMGALGLILGDRADSNVCRDAAKKCFIEGVFTLTNKNQYAAFFSEHEIELSDELIIRREISAQGKSRAFINDTPITLTVLKDLTSKLVDLHQQFDTLTLGDTDFQRTVIDALANVQKDLISYQSTFTEWKENEKKLQQLIIQKENFEKTESYKKHLLGELAELNLKENELEQLEQELKFLENAASIKTQLSESIHLLDASDNPIVQQLKQLGNSLESIVKFQPEFSNLLNRLKATQIELADIASDLSSWQDKIDFDDKKIASIQERLSLGYNLQKKHKVQTTQELLEIQQQLEQDLTQVLNLNDQIEQLAKFVKEASVKATALANTLTSKREKERSPFTNSVNKLLHQVGMPNAKIKVSLDEVPFNFYGKDKIDILFDANNTNKFEPIKKVASGGELSRLMLCIKSLVAKSVDLPTMIFDEIDTGISGEPAKQVGLLLQNLGQARQVLCITHQPQIAAKGNAHLYVYKEQKGNTTHTYLRTLNKTERVEHIAQMIGGDPPSKSALDNAKELLAS